MKKKKCGQIQSKYNHVYAKSVVERLSEDEKKSKIQELKEKGYEYNPGIHTLLQLETVIPYEFILYCLLIEDRGDN